MKFRKRPVVVEAEQWFPKFKHGVLINTPENPYVESGDWLITEENGDLTICKPDIFEATYEPVIKGATYVMGKYGPYA